MYHPIHQASFVFWARLWWRREARHKRRKRHWLRLAPNFEARLEDDVAHDKSWSKQKDGIILIHDVVGMHVHDVLMILPRQSRASAVFVDNCRVGILIPQANESRPARISRRISQDERGCFWRVSEYQRNI